MPWTSRDTRHWAETDRPGERLTIAVPRPDIEVISVSGSNRHWREVHDRFTLAIIHRNQPGLAADWRTRGRTLCAASGDIMAIEPGDMHVTERLSFPTGGADFDIVRISPALVAEVASELGVPAAFHFGSPAVRDPQTFDALQGLVETVAVGGDPHAIEAACALAVRAVISRLTEAPARAHRLAHPVRDYRLRRLIDYLHANLEKRPTLAELEKVAGLSQFRLCAVFKEVFGASIGTYWRALRANQAGRHLRRGLPIKMIVAELGYADESHFSREFKAHFGVTPGRWLSLH